MRTKLQYNIYILPLLLLLYTSTDTIIFGTNGNRILLYVPRIAAFLGILYFIGKNRLKLIISRNLMIMLFLSILTIVSGVFNRTSAETIISRTLPIVLAYFIVERFSLSDFIEAFEKVIYFTCIIAIILYVVSIIAPGLILRLPSFHNQNNLPVYTLFIGSVLGNVMNGVLTRMSGIFWEPGAFSIYLCFGVMFELYYKKNTDFKKIILYAMGIFTTFSTTGIIGLAVLLVIFLLKRNPNSKSIKIAVVGLILVALGATFLLGDSIIFEVFFSKIINRTGTTSVRYSSFINGMQIAFDHPLIGVGGRSSEYMMEYAQKTGYGYNTMITNTFVHQFANYGFIFGIVFLWFSRKFCFCNSENGKIVSNLLFVTIFILYFSECFYSFLPFVFIYYSNAKFAYSPSGSEVKSNDNCRN